MVRFWGKENDSGVEASKLLTANDAVQFWQREAYYYEGRAGEQGASANRMVQLGAGATAVLLLLANLIGNDAVSKYPDLQLIALVVPIVLFLLWGSAVRLLHEMQILRVYVRRAERKLADLAKEQPTLSGYTRWAEHGGAHDFTFLSMSVWFVAAAALSFAGAFGITYAVVNATHPEFVIIALAVVGNALAILVFAAADWTRDVRQIESKLGPVTEVSPPKTRRWLDVLGVSAIAALVISEGIAAAVLVHDAQPPIVTLNILAAFSVLTTIAGVVSGRAGDKSSNESVARRASKVVVTLGLAGSIAVILVAVVPSQHFFGIGS